MASVTLDGGAIADWPAFHRASREAFGFPEFYGANMSAWIDCLSGLRDGDGMSVFILGPEEVLAIELAQSGLLRRRAPHILEALEECVEEVNQRYLEAGEAPALSLVLR